MFVRRFPVQSRGHSSRVVRVHRFELETDPGDDNDGGSGTVGGSHDVGDVTTPGVSLRPGRGPVVSGVSGSEPIKVSQLFSLCDSSGLTQVTYHESTTQVVLECLALSS